MDPCKVVFKQLYTGGVMPKELEKDFNKKTLTLKRMKALHHHHVIEAVSVYFKGLSRAMLCVFQWAPGWPLHRLVPRSAPAKNLVNVEPSLLLCVHTTVKQAH